MNMKLIAAEERHMPQIAQSIASTGYWRACFSQNKLQLNYEDFIIRFFVKPQLPYTTLLVEEGNEGIVKGVLVSLPSAVADALPDFSPYLPVKISAMFSPIVQFQMPDGYLIYFLAVDKTLRGKGYGKKLFQLAETKAKEEGFDNIVLIAWSCNVDAIKLYSQMGMIITHSITCFTPEKLPLLCFQKNPKLSALINYFETEAYNKAHVV